MYARHAVPRRPGTLFQLGDFSRAHAGWVLSEQFVRFLDGELPDQSTFGFDPGESGQINQFDRVQALGYFHSHRIRVEAISVSFAVTAKRRDDGNYVSFQETLQQDGVNSLDTASQLVIDTLENSLGMGNQSIAVCSAQIVCRKAFQDFVGNSVGRRKCQTQSFGVRYARAVNIRGRYADFISQPFNLLPGAVNERYSDAQASQQGNIQQQVAEVVIFDDRPVERDDKKLV